MIYEAFIFAKEANPTHTRPLDGDWTVLRVTADQSTGAIVVETGGVDTEKTAKSGLEKAINEKSQKEVQWLVKDVASFKGVRQGDYVYVIANDPSLTLSQAAALAHAGEKSEDGIKGYIANINKDYLNGLTFSPEKIVQDKDGKDAKLLPNGKFIMAGREMIPVSPNIPSNGDFSMTIGLDREVAKVNFSASVSTNDEDAAKGKVAFLEGDGIVVARIARKASPFAEQVPDWYVPANNCVEDWPINDHALANGSYSAFCDGTPEGSFVFDGTSATPITDWVTGTTIPAGFNGVAPTANVTEYRYSWKLKGGLDLTNDSNVVYLSGDKGTIYGPMFYTTPNYSNNTNSVTVICTQATYTARGVFKFADMADKYIDAALAATSKDITLYTKEEVAKLIADNKWTDVHADLKDKGVTLPNMLMRTVNNQNGQWSDDDITTSVKNAIDVFGVTTVDEETYDATTDPKLTVDYATYKSMMERFYIAVLLQQRIDNKMVVTAGTKTDTKEATWGNGIETTVKDALLANATTDSLLVGWMNTTDTKPIRKANAFYIQITKNAPQTKINELFGEIFKAPNPAAKTEAVGSQTREYFATKDAYEYIKGQKLYYRADVANYVGGVSNKLTERNMYYVSKGTIQSLGAKSIHDAIYSEQNTMHIDVKVNDWKLSINDIPM